MRLHSACGAAILAAAAMLNPGAFAQTPRPGGHAAQMVGPANTAYLGIGVRDIDQDSARKFNLKEVRGSEVTSVTPDSPAAKAGLKEGDVVLEFNGQPIEGGEQLSRMVRETPIGRQVKIGVWRNGSMQTLTATIEGHRAAGPQVFTYNGPWQGPDAEQLRKLEEQFRGFQFPEMPGMPGMQGFPLNVQTPMLGIMGEPLGQEKQLADFFGVEDGVLVKSVNRDSAAEKAGIKAGDVIVKVDDTHISTSRDITMALRAAHGKKTVTVVVVRNKKEMTLPVMVESPATGGGIGSPVRAQLLAPELLDLFGLHE